MECMLYKPAYFKQLAILVRSHMKVVPPYVYIEDREISSVLAAPQHFCEGKYPPVDGESVILMGISNERLICAAQLVLPSDGPALLFWVVGEPQYEAELTEFLYYVHGYCRSAGCRFVEVTRNAFGMCWNGLPTAWDHLIKTFANVGHTVDSSWIVFWCNDIDNLCQCVMPDDFTITHESANNDETIEAGFFFGKEKAGEAYVWLPSPISRSLRGFFDLEYTEVYRPYRQKGYGKAALLSISREMKRHGCRGLMLWTEVDNTAMQNLARYAGLTEGPGLNWLSPLPLI